MSFNIRYLTNGSKSVYALTNSGVSPVYFEVVDSVEDIDLSVRHYAPKKATFCQPDLARLFGVLNILYPGHQDCGLRTLKPHNTKKCIAESCRYAPNGDWTKCKHAKKGAGKNERERTAI